MHNPICPTSHSVPVSRPSSSVSPVLSSSAADRYLQKKWYLERRYFDFLAHKLGIQSQQDWFRLTLEDIKTGGTTTIVDVNYGGCISKALCSVYPEYKWHFWKFSQ